MNDPHSRPGIPGLEEPQHPDVPDVLQWPELPAQLTVPVKHQGPIGTQELPAHLGTITQFIASTTAQVVLNKSQFRKKATLISSDNAFLIVPTRTVIGTNTAATWPANVAFVYTAQSELSIATTTGTATVSVITEDWAR